MHQRERKPAKLTRRGLIGGIGAGVIVLAAAELMLGRRETERPLPSASPGTIPVSRRETRPTLDPARFSGKAADAYRVAREIPDVLDQLTCYCACRSEYGHVSLLSCYTDGHGST